MRSLRSLSTYLFFAFCIHCTHAATFTLDDKFGVQMEGPIVPGDAEALIAKQRLSLLQSGEPLRLLYLSSDGGSLSEAIKLASLVESFRLDVAVTPGSHCASSCFLLYVA